jgi:hypothetical protein
MKKLFLSFLLISIFGVAHAGSSYGKITTIYAHTGDVILFGAGTHAGKPACSTVGDEWSISLATAAGRAMYALLLSAQAQGKAVTAMGANTCSAWGDRETPYFINLAP